MLSNRHLLARTAKSASFISVGKRAALVRPQSAFSSELLRSIENRRPFHSLALPLSGNLSLLRSPFLSQSTNSEESLPPKYQQVRWKGRKSGASALDPKPRRWSKKQKQRFRRKLDKQQDLEKHAPPGSKAGKRREYIEETHEEMINEYKERLDGTFYAKRLAANPLDDLEYSQEDALLDDLAGNAGHWTSQPSIEPVYTGHRQRAFYNRVADQMELYREALHALPSGTPPPRHLLPSDKDVGAAMRAYRDRHGTRNKPIGLAKALHHVLKELGIPSTTSFGELTYNALLSCCRTPKEAIRIFQLMQQNQHEISAYSWSILVDIHSKVGDFEGCVRVMDEMIAAGHKPNLPAYTSLLAACYKVCNDGRIAHSVRSRAGEVGWEKWQELRIVGLEPDVMCYGAILRLCAARGQPERAFNLLEEMPRFDVQPTTLCFSSALKALAKSHETAVRYERGWSKKNKRRERIAAHHGKLARKIVLLAEAAGIEQDDGFVSALQLCAAAAGDSATAKAIYLASEVRRNMKHLRQVGSGEHLSRLLGEGGDDSNMISAGSPQSSQLAAGRNGDGDSSGALVLRESQRNQSVKSYGEREYGKDTRTLSAILKACASASDTSMVGEVWSGRQNYGYLDLTSLRLIQERRKPLYRNTDIPGMTRTEAGMARLVSLEDMENPRKRNDPERRKQTRRNFPGMVTLDDVGTNLDDLSEDTYYLFHDKETGMLKQEYIDSGDYPEYEAVQRNQAYLRAMAEAKELSASDSVKQIECGNHGDDMNASLPSGLVNEGQINFKENKEKEVEWFFDYETRQWGTRPKQDSSEAPLQEYSESLTELPSSSHTEATLEFDNDASHEETLATKVEEEPELEEEWYFDDDARRWKTRMRAKTKPEIMAFQNKEEKTEPSLTEFEARALEEMQPDSTRQDFELSEEDEAEFSIFFTQLKEEVAESGEDMDVDEAEARELFAMMKSEFSEDELKETFESDDGSDLGTDEDPVPEEDLALPTLARGRSRVKKEVEDIVDDLEGEWVEDEFDEEQMDPTNPDFPSAAQSKSYDNDDNDKLLQSASVTENVLRAFPDDEGRQHSQMFDPGQVATMLKEREDVAEQNYHLVEHRGGSSLQHVNDSLPDELSEDIELQELRQLLPGLPVSRLMKVQQAYQESLSDPSMLTLVPILRERMPVSWEHLRLLRFCILIYPFPPCCAHNYFSINVPIGRIDIFEYESQKPKNGRIRLSKGAGRRRRRRTHSEWNASGPYSCWST